MQLRIYQMETTNYCNAQCEYCPHKNMTRKKGFISLNTVKKVIKNCVDTRQKYIALHHMGEPLLHKSIYTIIEMFTAAEIKTEFSSNGLLITSQILENLSNAGLNLLRIAMDYKYHDKVNKIYDALTSFYSAHPKATMRIYLHTVEGNDLLLFKELPVVTMEKPKDNWAGQIEGESKLASGNSCYFLDYNYGVVLWNGDIVNCCLDSDGKDIIGNIDNISKLSTRPFSCCDNCVKLQFAADGGWTK